jgi:hypothetical protein
MVASKTSDFRLTLHKTTARNPGDKVMSAYVDHEAHPD